MASSNPMVLAPKHLCEESETAIRIENNSLFLGTIKCSCLETALVSAHECHKRLRCFLWSMCVLSDKYDQFYTDINMTFYLVEWMQNFIHTVKARPFQANSQALLQSLKN